MAIRSTADIRSRLRQAGIQHFDELIHDQNRDWLIKHFSAGSRDYPVNVASLMRNIIWQNYQRIKSGEKPPLKELIRTFWYMYIKPTLSRADSLTNKTDQYDQLIDNLVYMVKDLELIEYKDIGFRDDNKSNRRVRGQRQYHPVFRKAGSPRLPVRDS